MAAETRKYLAALLCADRRGAMAAVQEAQEVGWTIADLYMDLFQPVQYEIGRLWQEGRITVAQEHYCTASTQLVMSQFYPRIFADGGGGPRFIGASVAENWHEMGMRMVCDLFQLAGWDTAYLGANMPTGDLARHIVDHGAALVGLSVSMPEQVDTLGRVIEAIRRQPGGEQVPIIVGGYVLRQNPGLIDDLDADGSARDAREAVSLAEAWRLAGGRA